MFSKVNITSKQKGSATPPRKTNVRRYPSKDLHQSDDLTRIAAQLLGSGKLTLSLTELVRATSFSRRTIRRWELKGELVALKATRTKVFLVSDVLSFLQRVR